MRVCIVRYQVKPYCSLMQEIDSFISFYYYDSITIYDDIFGDDL